jgi:MFS family permease
MNHAEINIGTLMVAVAASMITAWFTTQALRRGGFNAPGLIGFIAGALVAYGIYQLDESFTRSITIVYAVLGLTLLLLLVLGAVGKLSRRAGRNLPHSPDPEFQRPKVTVKRTSRRP